MAQKSLPILNKVNTSMIWYSTYYYKYYKWMSSQYMYLLYFFNKLFVFLNLFFVNCLWLKPFTTNMYVDSRRLPSFLKYRKVRFFKSVTSYLVNVNSKLIVINVYYKSSLAQFQSLSEKNDEYLEFAWELSEKSTLSKMFFI